MMLYQKIPTTSARIHPLMAGAAIAVIVFSAVATVAIVRWLPETGHPTAAVDFGADTAAPALPAGYATVSSPVPAKAARGIVCFGPTGRNPGSATQGAVAPPAAPGAARAAVRRLR